MMTWDSFGHGWMSGWMWIPMILFTALLVLGVLVLGRALSNGTPPSAEDPLTIARRRYAKGEITKDEYETLRATLTR